MITPITAHTSSHSLTNHINAMASHSSTKANDEANGKLQETSLHRRNDHQGTWCKMEEATAPDKTISSQTDTNLDKAEARYLADVSWHRVHFRGTALSMARQATVHLIFLNSVAFRLC